MSEHNTETERPVRVGFRYRDGLEQALASWEEPSYVDCTCGHPNADHVGGACPFPGCGCGVLDNSDDLTAPETSTP